MISSKRINLLTIILVLISLVSVILGMCAPWSRKQYTVGERFFGTHTVTFTNDDFYKEYNGLSSNFINLDGDKATYDSKNISLDDGILKIIGGGTYIFSGSFTGSIVIDSEDAAPVWIVLNGADITSQSLSAIYTKNAKKTIITAFKDTTNNITDVSDYSSKLVDDGKPNACIYSKNALTINGDGILNITGNYAHGVVCKDLLKITGGSINISAVEDAVNANSIYTVGDASICISAGDDAIHADEVLGMETKSVNITACNEGLESKNIIINTGNYSITSSDDAINATGEKTDFPFFGGFRFKYNEPKVDTEDFYLTINGGTIIIETSGDGIDSNGSILMNGGNITVYGPENDGNSPVDYGDGGYQFVMNGGSLIAVGSGGMAEEFYSQSKQITLAYYLDDWYDASSKVEIIDSNGKSIVQCSPTKKFDYICVSTASLTKNASYTLKINDTVIGTLDATEVINSYGTKHRSTGMGGHGMSQNK